MLHFAGSVAIICVCSIAAAAAAADAPNREAARASDTRHAARGATRSTRRNAISNDVAETLPDNVFADTTRTKVDRRPNNAATAAIIAHRDDTAAATSSTQQHLQQQQQQHHTTNGLRVEEEEAGATDTAEEDISMMPAAEAQALISSLISESYEPEQGGRVPETADVVEAA